MCLGRPWVGQLPFPFPLQVSQPLGEAVLAACLPEAGLQADSHSQGGLGVGPRFRPTLRGGGKEQRCSSILLPCKEKAANHKPPNHVSAPACTEGTGKTHGCWGARLPRIPCRAWGNIWLVSAAGRGRALCRNVCEPGSAGRGAVHMCEQEEGAAATQIHAGEREETAGEGGWELES